MSASLLEIPYLAVGLLMALAVMGVFLAQRFRQSLILAYIVLGLLIGPHLGSQLPGVHYGGLIQNEDLIRVMLEIGLVFVFLFVGLEFSITRLRETGKASAVIAVTHVSVNLFLGFLVGAWLGWPLLETLFLASVIAVSSVAVAIKSLRDLARLQGVETRFLLGSNIVEDFMLIIVMALASGWAVLGTLGPFDVVRLSLGVTLLYAFFIIVGFWIVPRLVRQLEKVSNGEPFVLFALASTFLAAAFAILLDLHPAFGSFFMGMAYAETSFGKRLVAEMTGIRNGFTALFFISFGMLIDVSGAVVNYLVPMLLVIVPLVLINEILFVSAVGYLMGFASKTSVAIGSALCGRGEDNLLYASVGEALLAKHGTTSSSAAGADASAVAAASHGAILFSFAGAYSFIMSALTLPLIRSTAKLPAFVARVLPRWMLLAAQVLNLAMHHAFFEPSKGLPAKVARAEKRLFLLTLLYIGAVLAIVVSTGTVHWALVAVGTVVWLLVFYQIGKYVAQVITQERLEHLPLRLPDHPRLQLLSQRVAGGLLVLFLTIGASFQVLGLWTVLVPLVVLAVLAWEMRAAYRATVEHHGPIPRSDPIMAGSHGHATSALPRGERPPRGGSVGGTLVAAMFGSGLAAPRRGRHRGSARALRAPRPSAALKGSAAAAAALRAARKARKGGGGAAEAKDTGVPPPGDGPAAPSGRARRRTPARRRGERGPAAAKPIPGWEPRGVRSGRRGRAKAPDRGRQRRSTVAQLLADGDPTSPTMVALGNTVPRYRPSSRGGPARSGPWGSRQTFSGSYAPPLLPRSMRGVPSHWRPRPATRPLGPSRPLFVGFSAAARRAERIRKHLPRRPTTREPDPRPLEFRSI